MKTNPLFLLAFLSLFLSGCLDEGGSSKKPDRAETPPATSKPEEPQPDESGPETPPVVPPLNPQPDGGDTTAPAPGFPEPTGAVLEEVNAEGFYDIDASGKPRAVRNDLCSSSRTIRWTLRGMPRRTCPCSPASAKPCCW